MKSSMQRGAQPLSFHDQLPFTGHALGTHTTCSSTVIRPMRIPQIACSPPWIQSNVVAGAEGKATGEAVWELVKLVDLKLSHKPSEASDRGRFKKAPARSDTPPGLKDNIHYTSAVLCSAV